MPLDELSSYTEALATWLASNCQDESQLLQGKALEDAKEWVGCRSLSEQDYQFLIASQELEKRELLKQLEIARQDTEVQLDHRQMAQFLANVTHALRTPTNGIICSLKLVIDGIVDDPEEKREFIDNAYHCGLRLLDMLNGLLDMAKIEAGRFSIKLLAPVKLYELLTEVENSVQAKAHEKQLNFQVIRSATQDEIITYGDYHRLREVMLTLVGDAIEYTDEGGITIVVEMHKQKVVLQNQEHPGLVQIHVEDDRNRRGQDSLLSFRMVRYNDSIYEWYGTPAFGLAISKKWIEAMGGEFYFRLKSRELGGAIVTLSLPLYQEPAMN